MMGGRRLAFLFVLAAVGAYLLAASSALGAEVYPTADQAAVATFPNYMVGWEFVGRCESSTAGPFADTVCYRPSARLSGEGFTIFFAAPSRTTDISWWLGVKRVEGGWRAYGHGGCFLGYCRVFAPDGDVIEGMPDGDVDASGTTDSVDALLILQNVAGLTEPRCGICGEVDGIPGLSAVDAELILQSEAGLIPGLPSPRSPDGLIP